MHLTAGVLACTCMQVQASTPPRHDRRSERFESCARSQIAQFPDTKGRCQGWCVTGAYYNCSMIACAPVLGVTILATNHYIPHLRRNYSPFSPDRAAGRVHTGVWICWLAGHQGSITNEFTLRRKTI